LCGDLLPSDTEMHTCNLCRTLAMAIGAALSALQAKAILLRESSASGSSSLSFEEYVRLHGRTYNPNSEEFSRRRALFDRVVEEVRKHNAQPDRLWTAAVNQLADRSDEELAALRGYSRDARPAANAGASFHNKVQLLGTSSSGLTLNALPQDFTWKSKLKATSQVQDQKACGSCWAFASSTVLRAHSELFQQDRSFSVQQIVSCTPNPGKCGGDGGCQGATAELAMDYVTRNGCVTNSEWPYDSGDNAQRCPAAEAALAERMTVADASRIAGLHKVIGTRTAGMKGYVKLPENQLAPIVTALIEQGPVAVSVSAGAVWNIYDSGIMNLCRRNAIIDHAVTLVGFGIGKDRAEQGHKYWQIQNSWGSNWGEGGYIRISRKDNFAESRHCGIDTKPELGSGCKGGPPQVEVCGTCGILYDAVVPDFKLGPDGLWSNESFVNEYRRMLSGEVAMWSS